MTTARIPRLILPFNAYLNNTEGYLKAGTPTTNADRLGILPEELATWSGFLAVWTPNFLLYSDKKNSRTTTVIEQLKLVIDNTANYDHQRNLLDRIASSPNVTLTDLTTFNIKGSLLAKTTHSRPTTPLPNLVLASLKQMGGGKLSVQCRSSEGGGISIEKDANAVEYLYKTGTTAPLSISDEGLKTGLSTRARFTLALGAEKSAQYAYLYFRWVNTKYPDLAGPWSALRTMLLI
ncbi:hypothetical protein [Mangrovibacterium lignilyticum]|uniref:hypothetical protein n=1 Tax=Mangrovibacterium lignilyticum TaxID=2668052 RepID=UPI0013D1BD54|nr:hypothetical protein [Mangrovibacterium lignilyticum]